MKSLNQFMVCYADRGEKKKVLAHLDKMKTDFSRELAAEPSADTLRLVQKLLSRSRVR